MDVSRHDPADPPGEADVAQRAQRPPDHQHHRGGTHHRQQPAVPAQRRPGAGEQHHERHQPRPAHDVHDLGVEQVQPHDRPAAGVQRRHADLERQVAAEQPAPQHQQRPGRRARPPRVQVRHHTEERDDEQNRPPGLRQPVGHARLPEDDEQLAELAVADDLVGQAVAGPERPEGRRAPGAPVTQGDAVDDPDQVAVAERAVRARLHDGAGASPGPGPGRHLGPVDRGHQPQDDERGSQRQDDGDQPGNRDAEPAPGRTQLVSWHATLPASRIPASLAGRRPGTVTGSGARWSRPRSRPGRRSRPGGRRWCAAW
jgi:hypothetical protein